RPVAGISEIVEHRLHARRGYLVHLAAAAKSANTCAGIQICAIEVSIRAEGYTTARETVNAGHEGPRSRGCKTKHRAAAEAGAPAFGRAVQVAIASLRGYLGQRNC